VFAGGGLSESSPPELDKGCCIKRGPCGLGAAFDFSVPQLYDDGPARPLGYLVLQVEHVVNFLVEAVSPKMNTVVCRDQLDVDAGATHAQLQAALQHIAHTELLR